MGGTDTREPDMSLTEQATETDAGVRPGRGPGERLVITVSVVVTLLAIVSIAYLALDSDEPAATPPAPAAVEEPADIAPVEPPAKQTPEDLAAAEAQERYREFQRVEDAVGQGGYQSSGPFDAVTVAPERVLQETSFRRSQGRGLRQIGTTRIASMSVTSVDLTPEPGGYPGVVLQVCLDVSGVDVVDGSGTSIVSPEREERSKSTVTMYQYEPGTKGAEAGGWYVYEATSKAEPC